MVRCDDFYCKWQKVGNFCEKHPKTAEQIEAYLNKILPLLEELAAESEILNDGSRAMAPELTERASRPLIYEKDPDVRHKAIKQIVKVAEEKVMDGKRPQVTHREVAQIVAEVKGEPGKEGVSEPARPPIHLAKEPRPDPVEAIQQWQEDLAARGGSMGLPRSIFTDLLELKSIRDFLRPDQHKPAYRFLFLPANSRFLV